MMNEEEVDDLLYCSRAGEADDLQQLVEAHVAKSAKGGNEIAVFNELMRAIASANEPHNTLLHFAAANGHSTIVAFLLPRSDLATLLAQNESGNTPLHWAALNGHLEIVKSLVKRIEELTPVPAPKDCSHLTEEERDAEEEKEAQKRSNWDVVNKAGKGPMSEAQMNNQEKVVEFLLQHLIAGLSKPTEEVVPSSTPAAENKVDQSLEGQTNNLNLE
ncbi:hypothetical protein CBS101457_006709 [Exobasidium rhododendri]|nr:hypothetical protein CBS101457_006709 [Exobasidium rhododendri]